MLLNLPSTPGNLHPLKRGIGGVIAIGMLLGLPSCKEKTQEYKIQSKDRTVITALSNSYENGMLYVSNGACNFYDYTASTMTPLCMKPNCTHTDKDCISRIIAASGSSTEHAVIYQDEIYYFTETESIEGEGKDTTYKITSTLRQCDLTSGVITDVLEIPDLNCTTSVAMVLDGSTLYFTASNGAYQLEDGTWTNAGVGKQSLCSVDLNAHTFENYGQINDNEFASNNVIIADNSVNAVEDQVVLAGVYADKIYLYYAYVEDQSVILDAIENNDYNIDWEYEVKAFDLESKEIQTVEETQPICLDADWYVTEDTANKTILATEKDGNTVELQSENELPFDCYQYTIFNHKIWDLYNGVVYDLKTGETAKTAEAFLGGNVVEYLAAEKQCVVCQYDASGQLGYAVVGEDMLTENTQ